MNRFLRRLIGCSAREERADALSQRQSDDHTIAMHALDLRVSAAGAAARESERAAQALLRRMQEDLPHDID